MPLVLAITLTAGCAADAQQGQVIDAASTFAAAATTDTSSACDLLAPGTREKLQDEAGADCATALQQAALSAPGRRISAERAGHSAQVRFTGDTIFLALFDDGWRVVAAGCERDDADPAIPYDCAIEGN